jgi:hypothetical protein
MPKKGSGITSVAKLKARCVIDRETGCWHYTGHVRDEKAAQLWIFNPIKQAFEVMGGAKAAAFLSGKTIPPRGRAWMKCRVADCVCPDHVMTGTMAEWGAFYREGGYWKGNPLRIAAVTAAGRARAKLDMEKARAIRESTALGVEEARRHGVHPEQVSRVRLFKAWREPSPFQGLGGR